jgi:hypothetical protein
MEINAYNHCPNNFSFGEDSFNLLVHLVELEAVAGQEGLSACKDDHSRTVRGRAIGLQGLCIQIRRLHS